MSKQIDINKEIFNMQNAMKIQNQSDVGEHLK